MSRFAALFLVILLSSCAWLPASPSVEVPPQQLFGRALDALGTEHRIGPLQEFQQQYPESIWARRAETVIRYAQEVHTRKEQLAELQLEKQRQAELLERLQQENSQLNETIEKLKTLLIDLEKRAN